MGLLLVYGLNTWLPQIMREAGYPLGAALSLLLVLNLGAVLGLLLAGRIADKIAIRPVTFGWFAGATITLALLSVRLPTVILYAVVLLAGVFVFAAQVLVYAYVGRVYPAANRATGLGWTAGVGRLGAIAGPILGGALLSAGIAFPWGFYAFAVVGAVAALAISVVERSSAAARAHAARGEVGSPQRPPMEV
jgi:MFS family permease